MVNFRLPFTMSSRALLGLPDQELILESDGTRTVLLRSTADARRQLRDATTLVVLGEGYSTKEEADIAGNRWRDAVSRAFARLHLAADFGDRKPFATLSEEGVARWTERLGHPVLGDQPGVTVYEDRPGLRFMAVNAEGCMRPSEERCRITLETAALLDDPLGGRQRLEFDLYSGSFFQPSADARLLMLAMAVETMLELRSRSDAAIAHVKSMIESTYANTDLRRADQESLAGSLKWLMDESIGQAGRKLATTLEPRTNMGKSPTTFFTACYSMRSALVHGSIPRPDRDAVDLIAAHLEVFVGDLLAGPLLLKIPD